MNPFQTPSTRFFTSRLRKRSGWKIGSSVRMRSEDVVLASVPIVGPPLTANGQLQLLDSPSISAPARPSVDSSAAHVSDTGHGHGVPSLRKDRRFIRTIGLGGPLTLASNVTAKALPVRHSERIVKLAALLHD